MANVLLARRASQAEGSTLCCPTAFGDAPPILYRRTCSQRLARGVCLCAVQSASTAPAKRSAGSSRVRLARSACQLFTAASQGSRTGPVRVQPAGARLLATLSKVSSLATWTTE